MSQIEIEAMLPSGVIVPIMIRVAADGIGGSVSVKIPLIQKIRTDVSSRETGEVVRFWERNE